MKRMGIERLTGCGASLFLSTLFLAFATARELSPNISSSIFDRNGHQSQPPLAVLRAGGPSGDDQATPPPELEIFAEDPRWAYKVEEFMISTGADAQGVETALEGVRQMSWAAGRTLRPKYLVLLAFAEDAQHDGDVKVSCRLVRAVLAASRHTTFAHFVLVADGFFLDASTRETVERALDDGGWRSFISVEVPEFEGFASAVNRAMNAISDNAVVAVLSTSALLLHASNVDTFTLASSTENAKTATGDVNSSTDVPEAASDIFIAYERLKAASTTSHGSSAGASGTPDLAKHGSDTTFGEEAKHNQHGHVHQQSNPGATGTLLVTALPSRVASGRQRDKDVPIPSLQRNDDGGVRSAKREGEYGQEQARNPEEMWQARLKPHAPTPPRAECQGSATRLSKAAPLPLLVFDTETLVTLGELDERYSFQGGIAEWISRAEFGTVGQGDETTVIGAVSCDQLSSRCQGSPKKRRAASYRASSTGSPFDGAVQHVHEPEWGRRFVRTWPEDGASAAEYHPSRGARAEQTSEEVIVDQWDRLSPAALEALVQADADLFFLPFLLSSPSPDSASHSERVARCVAFHSEWMGRSPDDTLVQEALNRRKQFPVAAVVVVHDDISLMRMALEEVALVVEHILVVVSVRPWNGGADRVEDTLELLNSIIEDVQSPAHGKLRVEVGSWATEQDQRGYGNSVIREDPRNFSRVVAMDTDEFWHPVELAKALVLAAKNPELFGYWAEMDTYWASLRSVIHPPEKHLVLWLVDPYRCAWLRTREVDCGALNGGGLKRSTAFMRHLSYVRAEEDVRRKMATFSHAGEEQSGWYMNAWRGWAANNSLTDLHPVSPENFKRVVVQPLFRLTPALRTLHLDAKKGRGVVKGVDSSIDRGNTSSPVSPSGRGSVEGRRKVCAEIRPHDENACRPVAEGTSQEECGSESKRTVGARGDGLDSNDGHTVRRRRKLHPVGVAGCEGKLFAQWTDWQRMMCLVPDADRVAAA